MRRLEEKGEWRAGREREAMEKEASARAWNQAVETLKLKHLSNLFLLSLLNLS